MKLFTITERKNLLEEIHRIVEIIKKDYDPDRIILFGSLAEGKGHEWSDIDLMIIKRTSKRPIERCLEVYRLIKPKIGIDLFIHRKSMRHLSTNGFHFSLISLKWERYSMERESREWIKIAMEIFNRQSGKYYSE